MATSRSSTRGMSLIELLVAVFLFSVLGLAASRYFVAMSRSFRKGWSQTAVVQNLNFAQDFLPQHIRAAGAHVASGQPALVYASANSFAFNADYASNLPDDPYALYSLPDAPASQVSGLTAAAPIAIPGSNPLVSYPWLDYLDAGVPSAAETITLFFTPDSETTDPADWRLMRQVNAGPAEVLIRNVLPDSGRPFFRYLRIDTTAAGAQSLSGVPPARLPVLTYGTAAVGLLDSLRAVEVRFMVAPMSGTDNSAPRPMRLYIPLTNVGKATLRTCGDPPVFNQSIASTLNMATTPPQVELRWAPAVDETGGQRDVSRYVIYRATAATDWGDPYASIPAGLPAYFFSDPALAPHQQYLYAVVAQDCTPSLSALSQTPLLGLP